MGALTTLLFVAGTGGIVVAAIAKSRQAVARRAAALSAAAARLGWGFHDEVALKTIPDLDRFELFRTGGRKRLSNLLTSPPGDPRAVIFDYAYTVSTGKTQHTVRQSIFYATSDVLELPSFSLRPEGFFHRVASAFGYQDIDLVQRPEFSRMFLLRGDNEAAVRDAFTEAVVEFFEAREDLCAAGEGHELLCWRPRRTVDPAQLEPFITEGFELAQRFASPRT